MSIISGSRLRGCHPVVRLKSGLPPIARPECPTHVPALGYLWWARQWYGRNPNLFTLPVAAGVAATSAGLLLAVISSFTRSRSLTASPYLHGSARWASKKDIQQGDPNFQASRRSRLNAPRKGPCARPPAVLLLRDAWHSKTDCQSCKGKPGSRLEFYHLDLMLFLGCTAANQERRERN